MTTVFKNSFVYRAGLIGVALLLYGIGSSFSHADAVKTNPELPKELTVNKFLQVIREKSPRYALPSTRIETAQADIVAAGVLPNPRLTYNRYDQAAGKVGSQFDGPSQQNITVEVPLLINGQRAARVEAAEKRVDAVATDVQAERNRLLGDAWRLFVRLQAAQEQAAVLAGAVQELEHLNAIITGKFEAGTASQYDVLRIVQEKNNLATRLENTRIEITSVTGEINTLLGFNGWQPLAIENLNPLGVSAEVKVLWQKAQDANPDLLTAEREIEAASAGENKARRERWPVPSLQMGTAFTDRPYGMASFVGVGVDVPIFDRGQGALAKAAAEKHASILKHELLLASTKQEIERAAQVLIDRRAILDKFETEVLTPLATLKKMSEDAYTLGKSSLLELLDATRSRTDIRLNYLELLANEINAEIDALVVSGSLIKESQ